MLLIVTTGLGIWVLLSIVLGLALAQVMHIDDFDERAERDTSRPPFETAA